MNSDRIIPEKEKNYIDTLYLSCNLQDHYLTLQIDGVPIAEYSRYDFQKMYFFSTILPGAPGLGDSSGYEWYKMPNYRIGFMDYYKAKRTNQPNCVIQYEHAHLFALDQGLTGLDLPFLEDRTKYMIKRIDITKTARLSTDYTKDHGYLSPFRDDPLNPIRHINTVYLGKRSSGSVFRMYSKTIELLEKKDYDKISRYNTEFGTIENLYTFEHELRRGYLKESLGIDTLAELDRVWMASQNIISKIKFFPINDRNIKLIKQNNRKRIDTMTLTPNVDLDLFLLAGDCSAVTCIKSSTTDNKYSNNEGIVYEDAPIGTYYIVVDAQYANVVGDFRIEVNCGYLDCSDVCASANFHVGFFIPF